MTPHDRVWHLGRRGVMLLLLGLLWIWIGMGVHLNPRVDPYLWHTAIPLWVRISEWVIPGVVAWVFAWRERDWPGWTLLMIGPIIRASSLITGWVVWLIPGGGEGFPRGLWSSMLYLFMVGVVAVCAGWSDFPSRPQRMTEAELRGEP